MPGITLPASRTASKNIEVIQHDTANDFLTAAYTTLQHHERSSNIIFAHALQRATPEWTIAAQSGTHLKSSSSIPHSADSFWLTVWSSTTMSAAPTLDLTLSCISSTLGNYPVFLWTPRNPSAMSGTWLSPRIAELTRYLQACVSPKRVFSVFGKTFLVKAFSQRWVELTGSLLEPEPFYAAYYSFCISESFKDSDHQMPANHCIRQATADDLGYVAQLCYEFAATSVFFPLTLDKACIEAEEMIYQHRIWIYEAMGEIASICAVGRDSPTVAAITKVYTTTAWRRNGFAEHLVRYVTRNLFARGKDNVVLYVSHGSVALSVYDRVGFAGLVNKDKPDGVEDALELGFTGTDRGHW